VHATVDCVLRSMITAGCRPSHGSVILARGSFGDVVHASAISERALDPAEQPRAKNLFVHLLLLG